MSLPLCIRCKHCEDIDIEGNVKCRRNHHGKAKIYCEDFEERRIEGDSGDGDEVKNLGELR